MTNPLDKLPFDVNDLIPHTTFNWDTIQGMDQVVKDVNTFQAKAVKPITTALASVQNTVSTLQTKAVTPAITSLQDTENQVNNLHDNIKADIGSNIAIVQPSVGIPDITISSGDGGSGDNPPVDSVGVPILNPITNCPEGNITTSAVYVGDIIQKLTDAMNPLNLTDVVFVLNNGAREVIPANVLDLNPNNLCFQGGGFTPIVTPYTIMKFDYFTGPIDAISPATRYMFWNCNPAMYLGNCQDSVAEQHPGEDWTNWGTPYIPNNLTDDMYLRWIASCSPTLCVPDTSPSPPVTTPPIPIVQPPPVQFPPTPVIPKPPNPEPPTPTQPPSPTPEPPTPTPTQPPPYQGGLPIVLPPVNPPQPGCPAPVVQCPAPVVQCPAPVIKNIINIPPVKQVPVQPVNPVQPGQPPVEIGQPIEPVEPTAPIGSIDFAQLCECIVGALDKLTAAVENLNTTTQASASGSDIAYVTTIPDDLRIEQFIANQAINSYDNQDFGNIGDVQIMLGNAPVSKINIG